MLTRILQRTVQKPLIPRAFSTVKADFAKNLPADLSRKEMNLYMAINSGLDVALETDKSYALLK